MARPRSSTPSAVRASSPVKPAASPSTHRGLSGHPGRTFRHLHRHPRSTPPSPRCGRAGANVTDIVVLVVAADDGLMPTTSSRPSTTARRPESPSSSRSTSATCPAPTSTRSRASFRKSGSPPEDYGGTTICVEVSAKTGPGARHAFRNDPLQAEVHELKANPGRSRPRHRHRGPDRGRQGAHRHRACPERHPRRGRRFICGVDWGKVKALLNDTRSASSRPVPPPPWKSWVTPPEFRTSGDELVELENERKAKKLSDERLEQQRQAKLAPDPAFRPRDPLQQHRAGQEGLSPPHHQGRCARFPAGHRESRSNEIEFRQDLGRDPPPERRSHHRSRRHPRERRPMRFSSFQHQGRGQGPAHREARGRPGEAVLHHLRTHRPGEGGHARHARSRDPREGRRPREDLQVFKLSPPARSVVAPSPTARIVRRARARVFATAFRSTTRLLDPAPLQGGCEGSGKSASSAGSSWVVSTIISRATSSSATSSRSSSRRSDGRFISPTRRDPRSRALLFPEPATRPHQRTASGARDQLLPREELRVPRHPRHRARGRDRRGLEGREGLHRGHRQSRTDAPSSTS